MLPKEHVRAHYDRFGARQDSQAYYEDPATDDMVARGDFSEAQAVFELGCGTGRFAAGLLERHLPATATYLGLDVSRTMVDLARARLSRFGTRVEVRLTEVSGRLPDRASKYDRFISNYVLDLLPEEDIRAVLADAAHVLQPGGLLCLVDLTHGFTFASRLVARAVTVVHALKPILVGGCRPIELMDFLSPQHWAVHYQNKLAPYGVPSHIVVAARK